jgi:hypothetical protein
MGRNGVKLLSRLRPIQGCDARRRRRRRRRRNTVHYIPKVNMKKLKVYRDILMHCFARILGCVRK